jgi:hypothetical protein
MDAMAAAQSGAAGGAGKTPSASLTPASAYASLMLSIGAASKCASALTSLLGLVHQFKAMASTAPAAEQQPYAVPSTSKFHTLCRDINRFSMALLLTIDCCGVVKNALEVMEASIVCLTNMTDYDVTINLGAR